MLRLGLLMLFTGLATAWLRVVVDPLIPAGDWHAMLSGLFVVAVSGRDLAPIAVKFACRECLWK